MTSTASYPSRACRYSKGGLLSLLLLGCWRATVTAFVQRTCTDKSRFLQPRLHLAYRQRDTGTMSRSNMKLHNMRNAHSASPSSPALSSSSSSSSSTSPLLFLEHVNINLAAWKPEHYSFYVDILGLEIDPRSNAVFQTTTSAGGAMKELVWIKIGANQIHIPIEEPSQVLRGRIGLHVPSVQNVIERIRKSSVPASVGVCENEVGEDLQCPVDGEFVDVQCPAGNIYRVHTSTPWARHPTSLDYVQMFIPIGTAAKIGRFYQHYLDGQVEIVPTPVEIVTRQLNCDSGLGVDPKVTNPLGSVCEEEDGDVKGDSVSMTCIVSMNAGQRLMFTETSKPIVPYDGHHIAIYCKDFESLYWKAHADNLNWDNPRFPQFTYVTVEDALKYNEFRIKDIIDPETKEVLYTLEHEIRSENHPSYKHNEVFGSSPVANTEMKASEMSKVE